MGLAWKTAQEHPSASLRLPSPLRVFTALTCCPKHLLKCTIEAKATFLMYKVQLSAGNTQQRAQRRET